MAETSAIDGFALYTSGTAHETEVVVDAYQAAQDLGSGFKLCICLDDLIPSRSDSLAIGVMQLIVRFRHHANQLTS